MLRAARIHWTQKRKHVGTPNAMYFRSLLLYRTLCNLDWLLVTDALGMHIGPILTLLDGTNRLSQNVAILLYVTSTNSENIIYTSAEVCSHALRTYFFQKLIKIQRNCALNWYR
jgi:hypothetical protein